MSKKILIVGGLHGDEPTGIELLEKLKRNSVKNIHTLLGNPAAIKQNIRYIETDMNRSFNQKYAISLEEKYAEDVKKNVNGYNLILDFHNTKALDSSCAIVVSKPNNLHLKICRYFGFKKIVLMPPSGSLIACHPDISISLEISISDRNYFSNEYLTKKILELQKDSTPIQKKEIHFYQFTGTVLKKTLKRKKILFKDLHNFQAFTEDQKAKLDIPIEKIVFPFFFKPYDHTDPSFIILEEYRM